MQNALKSTQNQRRYRNTSHSQKSNLLNVIFVLGVSKNKYLRKTVPAKICIDYVVGVQTRTLFSPYLEVFFSSQPIFEIGPYNHHHPRTIPTSTSIFSSFYFFAVSCSRFVNSSSFSFQLLSSVC